MTGLSRKQPPGPITATAPKVHARTGSAAELLKLGLTHHRAARVREAVAAYTQALAHDPCLAEAYSNRATARYQLNDSEGAFADFASALKLRPDYPEALNNRGVLRQALGDATGAMLDFDRALELFPDYGEALVHRAVLLNRRWEHARAVTDLTRALELAAAGTPLASRRVLLVILRGDALYHLGRNPEAMADYRAAFAERPAYFTGFICRTLADSLARHGEDAMFADCDRHLDTRPDDFMTLARRAVMQTLLGGCADTDYRRCYAAGDPADAALFESLLARARSRVGADAEGVSP